LEAQAEAEAATNARDEAEDEKLRLVIQVEKAEAREAASTNQLVEASAIHQPASVQFTSPSYS
jgi:hypothetical protein